MICQLANEQLRNRLNELAPTRRS